jgi:hypothetical protein
VWVVLGGRGLPLDARAMVVEATVCFIFLTRTYVSTRNVLKQVQVGAGITLKRTV